MTAAWPEPLPDVRAYPLIFTAESVRGIIAGTKSQTRRLFRMPKWLRDRNPTGVCRPDLAWGVTPCLKVEVEDTSVHRVRNPWNWASNAHVDTTGQSVRIWAREAWRTWGYDEDPNLADVEWRADGARRRVGIPDEGLASEVERWDRLNLGDNDPAWRSSLFMPRWASRLLLEITDVRCERLQTITTEDILAEGVWNESAFDEAEHYQIAGVPGADPERHAFAIGWDDINAHRAPWATDPWVWRITFRVLSPSESA